MGINEDRKGQWFAQSCATSPHGAGLVPSWILPACFTSPVETWPGKNDMMNVKACSNLKNAVQLLLLFKVTQGEGGRNVT